MEPVTRIGHGESNDHVGGSTTQVEHGRAGRPVGKSCIEQRDVGLMGLGEIRRRIGAGLFVRVHQLRFGNPFHWVAALVCGEFTSHTNARERQFELA